MKRLIVIILLFSIVTGQAQRLEEKNLPWKEGQEVQLDLKYAHEIQVQTWDRNEVLIRVSVTINDNARNDAWSLETKNTTTSILVRSELEKPEDEYQGPCEDHNYHSDGKSYCSLIIYDIYIPESAELRVETLAGNITLQGTAAAVYAKSLSGFVDVDWPAEIGATVSMKSITGEVYSDLNLEFNDASAASGARVGPVGWEIEGTISGGGAKLTLESISNDIYLRKAGSS